MKRESTLEAGRTAEAVEGLCGCTALQLILTRFKQHEVNVTLSYQIPGWFILHVCTTYARSSNDFYCSIRLH